MIPFDRRDGFPEHSLEYESLDCNSPSDVLEQTSAAASSLIVANVFESICTRNYSQKKN